MAWRRNRLIALGRAGGREQLRLMYSKASAREAREAVIRGLFNARDEDGLIALAEMVAVGLTAVASRRQPGSVFKPASAAAALEGGYAGMSTKFGCPPLTWACRKSSTDSRPRAPASHSRRSTIPASRKRVPMEMKGGSPPSTTYLIARYVEPQTR
mgnify:CR=1 FL=1